MFILPEDQGIYYRPCKQLFGTGTPQVYELRMVKKEGTRFRTRLEEVASQTFGASQWMKIRNHLVALRELSKSKGKWGYFQAVHRGKDPSIYTG